MIDIILTRKSDRFEDRRIAFCEQEYVGFSALQDLWIFSLTNTSWTAMQHTQNFSTARDSFLASLGSVLASSMRHVVTPSTADGAYHFYENVYFQIYFISEAVCKSCLSYKIGFKTYFLLRFR